MARSSSDSRDPRFRAYRVACYAVYLVVVVGFSTLVIISVVRSVLAMTPSRSLVVTGLLPRTECVDRAGTLYGELETERRSMDSSGVASTADAHWAGFRVEWLNRLRQAEASCDVESPARRDLGKLFHRLEGLEDLYTTSAVQYSGEIGPAVDGFRRALEAARTRPTSSSPSGSLDVFNPPPVVAP